jgi:hypothetical protein
VAGGDREERREAALGEARQFGAGRLERRRGGSAGLDISSPGTKCVWRVSQNPARELFVLLSIQTSFFFTTCLINYKYE